MIVGLMSKYY